MLGYATVGTNDLPKALAFYDALLADLNPQVLMEEEGTMRIYAGGPGAAIMVTKPHDGNTATPGNGAMLAIPAGSTAAVDAMHAKALELGGSDEGAPGDRGQGFYGAYFRDLDGNKLCAFHMG